MAKKRNNFTLNIGTSSVLLIFIVLCLVSFAVLSLSSAVSDYRISQKVSSHTMDYYNACNEAEETLASVDNYLKELYESGISRSTYFETVGRNLNYAFDISDIQSLEVGLHVLYPKADGDPFYEITCWRVITTGDLEYDESLNVMK